MKKQDQLLRNMRIISERVNNKIKGRPQGSPVYFQQSVGGRLLNVISVNNRKNEKNNHSCRWDRQSW
jgi:hypothetical protein